MDGFCHRPRVVIVGAGAAGALTALHLAREAGRRATPLEIVLVDPADRWAQGTAFGTAEEQHLLNVPTAGMSALPEDPSHFVTWRRRRGQCGDPYCFAPRREFARYLDETLTDAVRQAGGETSVEHRRTRAVSCRRPSEGAGRAVITTADGHDIEADAVVIATGLPAAGHDWAPDALRASAFFVPDPWARGALDVVRRDRVGPSDVLLVGTGLTMVDVTLSLTDGTGRADRVVRAISRSGRVPATHASILKPAAIPEIVDWGTTLDEFRDRAVEHIEGVERATGDWRPAVDGLRFQVAHLWGRLDEDDRRRFLTQDAGRWNLVRHRMAPSSRVVLRELRHAGRLEVGVGEVRDVEPLSRGGLRVTLVDGTTLDVGWVVNCTGPRRDIRTLGNPLLDDLLRPREDGALGSVATAGMGVSTVNGRLVDEHGSTDVRLWTLGALRRGELWESTAVPEIRTQALALSTDVLDVVARYRADSRTVDWFQATTPSPGRAIRSAFRSRPRPKPRPPTTRGWSG